MFTNILSDYKLIAKFKDGGKEAVYMGKYVTQNTLVAIKKLNLEQKEDDELQILCNELILARQFKHPNVNTILHSFVWNSGVYVLYPLTHGTCQNVLRHIYPTGIPELLIALILRDVLSALIYMHKAGFVHGSVKANNILLDRHKAILTGFRECRCFINNGKNSSVLYGISSRNQENLSWTAPEVLDQNLYGYTEKCDIYSVGITCCEMANGIQPYLDTQPTFMYTEKIRGNVPSLLDKTTCSTLLEEHDDLQFKPEMTTEIYSQRMFSDDFHQYAEICLNRNPLNRWSAQKLMTHSFFKQCRNTCISDQLLGSEFVNCLKIEDESCIDHDDSGRSYEDIRWDFD